LQSRGLFLEEDLRAALFEGAPSLGNFPVIDVFKGGNAVSIKSINLSAVSYADPRALERVLNRYADKLSDFTGAARSITDSAGTRFVSVNAREITSRELLVAVPAQATREQLMAFNTAARYASKLPRPVTLKIVPYK
jgi:hypothetical protein